MFNMPTISVKGLNELQKKFETIQSKIEKISQDIIEEVSSEGYDKMSKAFSRLDGINGNSAGETELDIGDKQATISQVGSQVGYIEFGTGYQGMFSPHPKAKEMGYRYAIGKKIRLLPSGVMAWKYYNKRFKKAVWTEGIQSPRPAWKVAKELRIYAKLYAAKKVGEVFKNG